MQSGAVSSLEAKMHTYLVQLQNFRSRALQLITARLLNPDSQGLLGSTATATSLHLNPKPWPSCPKLSDGHPEKSSQISATPNVRIPPKNLLKSHSPLRLLCIILFSFRVIFGSLSSCADFCIDCAHERHSEQIRSSDVPYTNK